MVTRRKADVEYRNIRLRIETYKLLEQRLLKFMTLEKNPKLTFDEALNLLLKREAEAEKILEGYEGPPS